MTLTELHEIAVDDEIDIDYIDCPKSGSISMLSSDGKCYIAIDNGVADYEDEEKVRTAHELGHCKTGAFYNRYSRFNNILKQEYKADKWAIEHLMPYREIFYAYKQGITEPWQLAEYFDLPQWFVEKGLRFYLNN